jgi:hypothetical protein
MGGHVEIAEREDGNDVYRPSSQRRTLTETVAAFTEKLLFETPSGDSRGPA